jgi:dTDP-glucose 4,6-dehydratase
VKSQVWLVTGGLGFIGSHFVRLVLRERPDVSVINFDAMTYAANPKNLADIDDSPRYRFVKGDICDSAAVAATIRESGAEVIVNFAAETHVDRSILDATAFLKTDIFGTQTLLEAVRSFQLRRFLQVSTDEVYGDVEVGASTESSQIAPRSPYAASKAGGDLQVLAYVNTYGIPALITRGSNTFGSHQFPEKLIPLFATNLFEDKMVPLYGDGQQVRDWLHAEDHARGILHALEHGQDGHIYNIGGGNPQTNLEITQRLLGYCGRSFDTHVRHVEDRAGHDRRYALDCSKLRKLGWSPKHDFLPALKATVDWYRDNESWWKPLKAGDFASYYARQYAGRGV